MNNNNSNQMPPAYEQRQRWGWGLLVLAVLAAAILVASDIFRWDRDGGSVVVYSGRREQFVTPVLERFEEQTGVRVRLLSGSATSFAHRLVEERRRPGADIFLANDAGVMEYLRLQDVLAPITVPGVDNIPPSLRADDVSWVGLSARVRVLMVHLHPEDTVTQGQEVRFDVIPYFVAVVADTKEMPGKYRVKDGRTRKKE